MLCMYAGLGTGRLLIVAVSTAFDYETRSVLLDYGAPTKYSVVLFE